MNVSAIIAEYNPLHKGHLYQINKTRELTSCDGLVCIMSGNFVQRGEPAVIDKWSRTRMALENGIDLVLELPVIYSLSSAEFFAHGAVTILEKLGSINNICFGSEIGDINILYNLAEILVQEPDSYKSYLKNHLNQGNTYPVARSKALLQYIKEQNKFPADEIEDILNNSNNILGVEYCKSLIKNTSKITPFTVKREGGAYNSTALDEKFSSATAIRRLLREHTDLSIIKTQLPENSYKIIKDLHESGSKFTFDYLMLPFIKYKCFQDKSALENIPDATEGLHNRIYDAVVGSNVYGDIISKIKTRRYTYTRIARIMCQLFVGFEKYNTSAMRSSDPCYVRVLGFNNVGKEILRSMKKNEQIAIYTKLPSQADEMLQIDLMSTRMYSLINKNVLPNSDYLTSPIIYE